MARAWLLKIEQLVAAPIDAITVELTRSAPDRMQGKLKTTRT